MTRFIGKVKNCPLPVLLGAVVGLGVWLMGARAFAADGELQGCVQAVLERVRASGARPAPMQTRFLLSGDSEVFAQRFERAQCTGFLVAGARYVQAIELLIQSPSGKLLAHSAVPATFAYLVHCGQRGEQVFAGVRMLDGQGEIVYVPIEHAEARPAALAALEQCTALGTPRPAPIAVGPEPAGKSIEEQFEVARTELTELGYGADQVVGFGTLPAEQHDARGLVLRSDACYALVAAGSRDVLDLDMRVFGPGMPLAAAGSDVSRKRRACVKLCALPPARYVLDVSAFQGEGAYAVQAYELSEAPAPAGITGRMRIGYAEAVARMRSRGMAAEVVTSGIVDADDAIGIPLPLRSGACYAVAAVAATDPDDAALQLGLRGEQGELVALDARPNEVPLVFHCAAHDELLQAVVRTGQTRNSARFALLLGRPVTSPTAERSSRSVTSPTAERSSRLEPESSVQ